MLEHQPLLPLNIHPATNALRIVSDSKMLRPGALALKKAIRVLVMPKNKKIEISVPYRRGQRLGEAAHPGRLVGRGQRADVAPQPGRGEEQDGQQRDDYLEEPELPA